MAEWFCGFETGNVNDDFFGGAGHTISTSSPRSNNFCGKFTAVGAGTTSSTPGLATNSVPYGTTFVVNAPFSMSCGLRFDLLPAANSEEFLTISGLQFRINSAGKIELWNGFPTTLLRATGTTVLTAGVWYIFEMYITATVEKIRIYPDNTAPGADEFSVSLTTMGSSGFNFGKVTNRNGQSLTFSVDDIWAKDGVSGYIGESRTYLVSGLDATPIYDDFTRTPPTGIDGIWSETPSIPATYCSSNVAGAAKQTAYHHQLWPIGSTATINAVKTTVIGANSQVDALDVITLVGPIGSIVETAYPVALQFTSYWSVMWSPVPSLTDLNQASTGVSRHAGSANPTTIYECHVQTCYSNLVLASGNVNRAIVFVILSLLLSLMPGGF